MSTVAKFVEFLLALTVIVTAEAVAQEFKPHPSAKITKEQWTAYFEEVRQKHKASEREVPEQKLVTYSDRVTDTTYAFTTPGHPAHPAWIARRLQRWNDSLYVQQIGYFAGAEEPFARLHKAYQELNEQIRGYAQSQVKTESPIDGATGSVPEIVISPRNVDKDWRPTADQLEKVLKAAASYFKETDTGDHAKAFAQWAPDQTLTFEQWSNSVRRLRERSGTATGRVLKRVTWYKNPPGAVPGVYAAIDFTGGFTGLALHCGYVTWQQQLNGDFMISREETNTLDKATFDKLRPGQFEQVKREYGCS